MPKLLAPAEIGEVRRRDWIELLENRFAKASKGKPCEVCAHPDYAPFQAPRTRDGSLLAICLEEERSPREGESGAARTLVASASVIKRSYPLLFSVGPKEVARVPIRVAAIFGSEVLLGREDRDLVEKVLLSLDTEDLDAVLLEAISLESFFGNAFVGSKRLHEQFSFHWLGEASLHRVARLPASFEAYLQTWKSKRRNQYRNLIRDFEAACKEGMSVRTATMPEDVEWLYNAYKEVGDKSWKTGRFGEVATESDRAVFRAMAEKGWLLSYVLFDGKKPVAVAFGCTIDGAWLFEDTVYDPALADFSPGRVLLYLLFEDLFRRRIRLVDFGTGDNQYKEVFANDVYPERKLLLCRKTPKMLALGAAFDVTHEVDHRLRRWMKDKGLTETMRSFARGNISLREALSAFGERTTAKKADVQKKD